MIITMQKGIVNFQPETDCWGLMKHQAQVSLQALKSDVDTYIKNETKTPNGVDSCLSHKDPNFMYNASTLDCIEWVDDLKGYDKDYDDVLKFIWALSL